MTQSFFVPGPLPGVNDIVRKHHFVYSLLKKQWGTTIQRCIQLARLKPMQTAHITYRWIERNQKRDLDNIAFGKKFVNDALQAAGILKDDNPRYITGFADEFAYEATNPGVLVTLTGTARKKETSWVSH